MAFIKPKPQPEPKQPVAQTILQRIEELRSECEKRIEDEAARIKREDAPSIPLPVIMQGLMARYRGNAILAVEAIEKAK